MSNNQHDRKKHGTNQQPCGENHHRAKLTNNDVHKIREMYAQGTHTHKMLAEKYGVSMPTIEGIVTGKYWKHLPFFMSKDVYAKIKESHKSAPPPFPLGAKHPNAKLTDEEILQIRELYGHGHSFASLGKKFGITKQSIWAIVRRQTWKHL